MGMDGTSGEDGTENDIFQWPKGGKKKKDWLFGLNIEPAHKKQVLDFLPFIFFLFFFSQFILI